MGRNTTLTKNNRTTQNNRLLPTRKNHNRTNHPSIHPTPTKIIQGTSATHLLVPILLHERRKPPSDARRQNQTIRKPAREQILQTIPKSAKTRQNRIRV